MKKFHIFTIFSIVASLFVLMNSQQVCLPDGCFYAPQVQVCQDGNCMNEDVSDHFEERSDFLLATVKDSQDSGQILITLFVFALSLSNRPRPSQLNEKFKSIIKNYALVHNRLINLFAKGVLHPKIY